MQLPLKFVVEHGNVGRIVDADGFKIADNVESDDAVELLRRVNWFTPVLDAAFVAVGYTGSKKISRKSRLRIEETLFAATDGGLR